jgi:hypothetical protein
MHQRQYLISLLFIVVSMPSIVAAECLACWSLHGVKVSTYKGDTIVGYVAWNPYWLTAPERVWGLPFPKSMMNHFNENKQKELSIYRDIHWFKFPDPYDSMLVCSTSVASYNDILTVKIAEISKILRRKGKYDAFEGAGEMPVLSKTAISLTRRKPLYWYHRNTGVSDIYFYSYNSNVNADSLVKIADCEWYVRRDDFEKNRVLIIEISYD